MTLENTPLKPNLRNPVHVLAFGFGSGLSPIAPGTMGTLVAVPIYLGLQNLPIVSYAIVVLVLIILGIFLCQRTALDLNVHDHPGIVWDEIVGYLVTMIAAPAGWVWLLVGFILFRFFDIVKPWPISWIDANIKGGLGIMLDDLVAAVIALMILQIAALYITGGGA
jgi:phosphatidylglycerophosphatase A